MKWRVDNVLRVFLIFFVFTQCTTDNDRISMLGEMNYPKDNLFDQRKVDLGRMLFFDRSLSVDSTISCASCHLPSKAFTDQIPKSKGVTNHFSMRNAPSLLNVGYATKLMYDAEIESLEMQVLAPIQDTNEMGFTMGKLAERLSKNPTYSKAAKEIFNRPMDAFVITRSLAAFQRTLISDNSRFDQWSRGEVEFTESEELGYRLFTQKLYCSECHPAPYFTTFKAANNGLYSDYGSDKGRFRINGDSSEIGAFKIPSLRNVSLTFPYMHDGSIQSLKDVINHYESGGKKHFNQSEIIQPFTLSNHERDALIDFLESLTDTSYLRNF